MPQISLYAECAALIASTFLFFIKVEKHYRFFFLYMLVDVTIELSSFLIKKYYHHPNLLIYNIFVPLEAIFFMWAFTKVVTTNKTLKIIYTGMGGYVLFVLLNALFFQTNIFQLHTYDLIAGNILLSAAAIFYLQGSEYKQGNNSFLYEPMFWVSIGLLLYALPMSIMYTSFEYMAYKKIESKSFYPVFSFMNNLCNILEYLCFSVGFTCRLRLRTL